MARKKDTSVVAPNKGLRFDRPAIALDPLELQDGLNFRITKGTLNNLNLGYTQFGNFTLDSPARLITNFLMRSGDEHLIFATLTDLYRYNPSTTNVVFLTPVYTTGTAAASGTAVTGTGTIWSTNAKAGDKIAFGAANVNDPAATWFTIATVNTDTGITLTASAGTVGNGAYTIRRLFSGNVTDLWTPAPFIKADAELIYFTNGVDPLTRWNGTDAFATRLDAFALKKIKAMTVFKNMMIYGNFERAGQHRPTAIVNSDVGDPENVTAGLSEEFIVYGGTEPLRSMMPMGDSLIIYARRIISTAQFVDAPLIFLFRTAATGFGLMGPRAIADFGDYHIFLAVDNAYKFDGVTVTEWGQHIWREVIRRHDPTRSIRAYSFWDEENGELIWAIPLNTDAGSGDSTALMERSFVQHYLELDNEGDPQPYSARDFPFTAVGYYFQNAGTAWSDITETWAEFNFRWNDQFFSSSFPLNLAGKVDGKVYVLSTAQNLPGGLGINSFVRFGRRATGDARMRGLVRRVYPFADTLASTLNVRVRLSDSALGTPTITHDEAFDLSQPEGGHFVSVFRRGRFFDVQFGSAGPSEPWILGGYDVDVSPGGRR